ncbi:MAG: hypothetical protein A3K19_07065 [Lentisphaerae bacterium RIFOXYB12_FULL_65_16]|nr:MAG: hypothetical protein A3K18_12260 [Lentisphaerae bacterium RIFOXYA12_64_32]OGV93282.1 MAG: hypothetical protein A3K19_07065 [Lentisphaerae bacterium RIFOXYB12_FULL_65_16]
MDHGLVRQIILDRQLLDVERLRGLEGLAASSNKPLLDSLLDEGYLREEQILPPLASALGVGLLAEDMDLAYTADLATELPEPLRNDPEMLPICRSGGRVIVAVSDPLRVDCVDRLRQSTDWIVELRLASRRRIERIRNSIGGSASVAVEHMQMEEDKTNGRSLEELANEAPIVKLVNLIVMQGISEGASDIHIEPYEKEAVVRYRVDGVLKDSGRHPMEQYPAMTSRIKILADLNIAERRIPQDGRISLRLMERVYDLRVATIPCLFGEGIVMRILAKENVRVSLEELGFGPGTLAGFQKEITKAHGIVLVTGPTGSGKTTSLYAALDKIKSEATKIITVEDPVEYDLAGINQIPVNAQVGMTFAVGLRSILRLDPDIIMVGEIRDEETATIAIRSALTGHLVFSTLHTNDAISAVTRLVDMGVAPYLVAASVNAILAQRLVRRTCAHCRAAIKADEAVRGLFASLGRPVPETVVVGKGCDECSKSGYKGRLGLYELFCIDDTIRERVAAGPTLMELRKLAVERGFVGMREDGADKVLAGLTTVQEVIRVTQE